MRSDIFLTAASIDAALFRAAYADDIPLIVQALLAAEDHRGRHHTGIDVVSLIRGSLLLLKGKRIRGISTIEQQYARIIFTRSGSLLLCKLHELGLVAQIRKRVQKETIWLGYLWRAYYGQKLHGYAAARGLFLKEAEALDEVTAAKIVSCLKYPRPRAPSGDWERRHHDRIRYVLRRMLPADKVSD